MPDRHYSCMLALQLHTHLLSFPYLFFFLYLTHFFTYSFRFLPLEHTFSLFFPLPVLPHSLLLTFPSFSPFIYRYVSSQAVHDPFADNNGKFPDGVPRTYMNPETYDYIYSTYQGGKIREYYKSLAVLDRSIEGTDACHTVSVLLIKTIPDLVVIMTFLVAIVS